MLTTTRIQEKGQVTIPQEIRKKLRLKKGDSVTFMETDLGVTIMSLEDAAKALLAELKGKLDKRGISTDELMARSIIAGGKVAAREFGLSGPEKEIFDRTLRLRLQAALEAVQAEAKQKGTDKLTDEEVEAEIQAARRGM